MEVPGPVRSPSRYQGWTAGFPDDLRQLSDSVVRSEPRTTAVLVDAADELVASGVDPEEAVRRVFGRFPVGGLARYGHDWWYPRFGPGWRLHQGTDVFADHGTPVRAPTAGVVSSGTGALGGLYVRITGADGSYWYLAHLSGLVDGFRSGRPVEEGDVVGYVGNSGNARTTPPHVHAEYHPGGGPAVDSKPLLDRFLDEAEAALHDAERRPTDDVDPTGRALPPDRDRTTDAGAPDERAGNDQGDRSRFTGAGGGLAVEGWVGAGTGAASPPAEPSMIDDLDAATAAVMTAGDGADPAIVVVAGGLTLATLFGRGRGRHRSTVSTR